MIKDMRIRFWIEVGMATITTVLFVITLVWKDWIEIVFHIDPDRGSGSFEWLIVGVLLVVTTALFVLARYEWRKAQSTT